MKKRTEPNKCSKPSVAGRRPQANATDSREKDTSKRVNTYELELFNRRVAKAVNISPHERFYEGLPPLDVKKQPHSSGPGCAKGAKKELSSKEKLSQTLLASSKTEDEPPPRAAFSKPTFTLENAPSCRAFRSTGSDNTATPK